MSTDQQLFDPQRYRVEWRGVFGRRFKLWWWDDGLYSGGETEGWQLLGEFDERVDGEPLELCLRHEANR